MKLAISYGWVAVLFAATALSRPGLCAQTETDDESSDTLPLPAVLDPALRHQKAYEIELSPFAGTYVGPSADKSWIAGGRLHLHFNNMFAVGAAYGFQWLAVDSLSCEGPPLEARATHYLDGELVISNDVAMRMGSEILEMDLFLTLGAGAVLLDAQWEFLGVAGGGIKFYTGLPWLAVRIDVNTYIHRVDHPRGAEVDTDFSFALSLAFLIPTTAQGGRSQE